MIIADTDVLIDFLKDQGPGADRVAQGIETGALRTTVVTEFELLSGARNERQQVQLRELLAVVVPLPLSSEAASTAASVRRQLELRGKGIGTADYLIAGIALVHGAALLTRNRRHFERIEALHLI